MSKHTLRRLFLVASIASALGACAGEEGFVPDPTLADDTCVGKGMSDLELIADARYKLQGEEKEDDETVFSNELAEVLRIEDLNGDNKEDYIVKPGFSYSSNEGPGANVDQTIYFSNAEGCAGSFAGSMSGSLLYVTEDGVATFGVRDVQSRSVIDCTEYIRRYKYNEDETLYGFSEIEINDVVGCVP